MSTYYKPGCWNVICQLCGVEFKSDEIRKRWDGVLVCKNDWEPRHELDFIRNRAEHSTVPYVSSEPADVFVDINDIYAASGQADIGKADFAKADTIIRV